MAEIHKGKISIVAQDGAQVIPDTGDDVTRPLAVPWWLRDEGALAPDVSVLYVVFEDTTGMILARADGEGPQ